MYKASSGGWQSFNREGGAILQSPIDGTLTALLSVPSLSALPLSSSPLVAMYREPSLHDVGETVPKAPVPASKSTSEPAVMNGGKPVSKPDKPAT